MHATSIQKLTLLVTILNHFSPFCSASTRHFGPFRRCERHEFWCSHDWMCDSLTWHCSDRQLECESFINHRCSSVYCLLPPFQCSLDLELCIPRIWMCDGVMDCPDGSDEGMFCRHTTTARTIRPDTEIKTSSSYLTTVSKIFPGFSPTETTSVILQESGKDTTSSSTDSTKFPMTEVNTTASTSTANLMFPKSKENTPSSTTDSVVLPDYEENISTENMMPSESEENISIENMIPTEYKENISTENMILPESEENILSLKTENTVLPESEKSKTFPTTSSMNLPESEESESFPTTSNMNLPESEESKSFPTTNNMNLPESEEIKSIPTSNEKLPESEDNTLSSTMENTMLPEYSNKQSCPDKYCMHNAECIIIQGQYFCKCHSSFIGERCEIKLKIKQDSRDYAVAITMFMTLAILCLAVVSVAMYRYKRLSKRRTNIMASKTESQMTLTSHIMEQSSVSMPYQCNENLRIKI